MISIFSGYCKFLTLLTLTVILIPLKASAGMMDGTPPENNSDKWSFFWTIDTAQFVVKGDKGTYVPSDFNSVLSVLTDDGAWKATVDVLAKSGLFDDELHVDLTLQHLYAVHQGDQCCGGVFSYNPSLSNLSPGIADLPLGDYSYSDSGKTETLSHPAVHLDVFEGIFTANVETKLSGPVPGDQKTHRITGFIARLRAEHNGVSPS